MRRLLAVLLMGCGGETVTAPEPMKPCPILFYAVMWRDSIDQTTGNLIAFHVRLDTLTIAYSSTVNCLKVGEH